MRKNLSNLWILKLKIDQQHDRANRGLPSRLFALFDINFEQLIVLLRTKKRAVKQQFSLSFTAKNLGNIAKLINWKLVFLILLGIPVSFSLLFESILTGFTINYTAIMFVSSIVLVSYFTSEFLETNKSQILLSMPISSATIFAFRFVTTFKYLVKLTITFSIASLFVIGYLYSISTVIIYLISLLLSVIFFIVIVSSFFLIVLRKLSAAKLQNGMLISALLISIMAVVMINLPLANMTDATDLKSIAIKGDWLYLFPPAWMAGLTGFSLNSIQEETLALALLAVFVPVSSLVVSIFLYKNRFTDILLKLVSVNPQHRISNIESVTYRFKRWLLGLISHSSHELSFHLLYEKLMAKEQFFKQRIYPVFGMLIAAIGVFAFNHYHEEAIPPEKLIIFLHSISFIVTTITMVQYSDNYKAAWLFKILPLNGLNDAIKAVTKSFMFRFIIPLNILVFALTLTFWGVRVLPDLAFYLVANLFLVLLQIIKIKSVFPFSQDFTVEVDGVNKLLDQFLILIPLILTIGLHFFLRISLGDIGVILGSIMIASGGLLAYYRLTHMLMPTG